MPQQRKRATIRDVAEATGLSPAAVSYALRGVQTSEETQERVRSAAAELGYKVDRIFWERRMRKAGRALPPKKGKR